MFVFKRLCVSMCECVCVLSEAHTSREFYPDGSGEGKQGEEEARQPGTSHDERRGEMG